MKYGLFCLGVFFTVITGSVSAQYAQIYEDGPVHEAYVTASTENGVILQAIALQPPAPIVENPPPQCHPDTVWIPGYWAWEEKIDNFVWVSGVWRRPPTSHVWISGYWNQFDSGWAWVRGFWSSVPEHQLVYIQDKPHEPREEVIPQTPGPSYFWMPGYWDYHFDSREYRWLSGRWGKLDPNWVYVPAYYLWRPNGFLYIPAYWDLPLQSRGCAYNAVTIEPQYRSSIVYVPDIILDDESILRWCFLYYPNYPIFFWHHRHYYPSFWDQWCCTPPWWSWDSCWCFHRQDNWWLWWWWTNPGFQNPPWITINFSMHIHPPSGILINWIRGVMPPVIVTPWGVVSPWDLMDAIGGGIPVMPADPNEIAKILDKLKPNTPQGKPLLPTGKGKEKPLPRPNINGDDQQGDGHVIPPPKPGYIPPPPPPARTYPPRETPVRPPTYRPEPKPPVYVPPRHSKPPVYYPPQDRPHHPKPPRRPPHRYPPHRPHGRPPQHEPEGYPPQYIPERPHRKPHRFPPIRKPNWQIPWGGDRDGHDDHGKRPQRDHEDRDESVPQTTPGGFF